ncbi:MAG: holo-ACP synthase [Phycisphaerales bacterium]
MGSRPIRGPARGGEPSGSPRGGFAAKEAVLKALGTGWRGGIAWTDVEVVKEPSGRPGVALFGEALATATRLGVGRWHLSLSHAGGFSVASAVASR